MKCICNNCMNYPCTDGMSVMLKSCPGYNPIPKPQTNADRIRAMSDEELAYFLNHDEAGGCPAADRDCQHSCENCWLDWLKSEVTE